jgi:hypothetical protein
MGNLSATVVLAKGLNPGRLMVRHAFCARRPRQRGITTLSTAIEEISQLSRKWTYDAMYCRSIRKRPCRLLTSEIAILYDGVENEMMMDCEIFASHHIDCTGRHVSLGMVMQ